MKRTARWMIALLAAGAASVAVAALQDGAEAVPALAAAAIDTAPAAQPPPAQSPGEIWLQANAAYEEGRFSAAVAGYRALLGMGVDSGHLYFNLGNAHLRNGELGRAVASFRRSRALLPRDEDVRANLSFARASTRDALAPPDASPALATLFFWHYGLSQRELTLLLLVVNGLFWALLLVRLFFRDSEVLRWSLIFLLVLLLGTSSSLLAHRFFTMSVAVILPPEIEARTGPDLDSLVRFKLHAGTEVRVKGRREDWLRIALPDGQQAWIDASWAEVVGR